MGIFDNYFGKWIKVLDYQNNITIENYGYDTGIIEGTTKNHCVKCVAVNQCWFKDEINKKPETLLQTGINILDNIIEGLVPGLYHYRCHCKEYSIENPTVNDIELIVSEGKILYLFSNKKEWVEAMGYQEKDFEKFVEILFNKTKEAYVSGNYYKEDLSKYGIKINIKIDMSGFNNKKNKIYKIETNYMVFPNGKLKMNTPIGGWQK